MSLSKVELSYELCGAGTFVAGLNCTDCPVGTFTESEGAQVCQDCYAGTFSDSLGTAQCQACIPGRFSLQVGLLRAGLARLRNSALPLSTVQV